jgi:hypothetical protein
MNCNVSEAMEETGNWEICQYRKMYVMLKMVMTSMLVYNLCLVCLLWLRNVEEDERQD